LQLNTIRPTWVEINLDNIFHNVREIRRLIGRSVRFMAVVKADGYGHGALEITETALEAGADWLGVAIFDEALHLRNYGITVPILILGYTPESLAEEVIRNRITQTIYTFDGAEAFSEAAKSLGVEAVVHIKIDTGMGRIGFLPETESIEEIIAISRLPNLKIEGIFTHFATADEGDKSYTWEQIKKFGWFIQELEGKGLHIPVKHVANSAAIIDFPDIYLDMVRAGVILYGLYPSKEVEISRINLKPAMTFKTRVSHVKKLPPGKSISYGATYTTKRESIIATLPVGYADGYNRLLSNRGEVLINSKRAPIVGRICMDQCMVDITHIPGVSVGDEAILFGMDGKNQLHVDEVAQKLNTINYEVVCMVSKRVPRVYIKNGKICKIKDIK